MFDRREFLRLTAASVAVAGSGGIAGLVRSESPPAGTPAVEKSIAKLAANLGHNLERIFRHVQREIRYEPYVGILRGATGTLLARAGNSADQARLLAELLRASAIPYRFVTGALDASAISVIMATTVVDGGTARLQAGQAALSDEDRAAGIHPMAGKSPPKPPAGVKELRVDREKLGAAMKADVDAFGKVATSQAQSSVATIMKAVATTGSKLAMAVSAMPSREQSAHVWVQANAGSKWLDLDPVHPNIAFGKPVATAAKTMESLPNELRHRVSFHVIAEQYRGGSLVQETILDHEAFADDLVNTGILFTHVKPDNLATVGVVAPGLSGSTNYNPVLQVGAKTYIAKTSISIAASGGGSFADVFAGESGEGITDGETVAEWLEVRAMMPEAKAVVARRALFDRIGQAMRESGAIDPNAVPPADVFDLGPERGEEYLPCRAMLAFSVTGGPVNIKALMEASDPNSPGLASVMAGMLHASRDSLSAELADAMGCRSFVDAPNIVSWKLSESPDAVIESLDIWHRSFGTLGIVGRKPIAPPALIAGVLAHTAERLAMGEGLPSRPMRGPSPISVGALFDLANAQKVPVRAVLGKLPDDLKLEPEHVSTIRAAVTAGKIVVVPERAIIVAGRPHRGWWLVEPGTGATVDQLEDGSGAAQVEYKGSTMPVSRAERIFSCAFFFLPAVYTAIAYALSAFDFPIGAMGFAGQAGMHVLMWWGGFRVALRRCFAPGF